VAQQELNLLEVPAGVAAELRAVLLISCGAGCGSQLQLAASFTVMLTYATSAMRAWACHPGLRRSLVPHLGGLQQGGDDPGAEIRHHN
jgi:hypothetical protein